ncbi:hypothetical protein DGI_1367 [Megalodesulfovibrio gigas DSM 1382 = ATCC 19364]|uniref:Uncharacterized protein n=1 Tax=Megalodesulfovibrio gigas (strain ATCC 19364 / DSM 1382 / NCIMB 9332 / VKM B-1759) TaxID=1121448 RepID=T2GAA2_MEGG1|nr:hypothetical protein DGI_1367 [Megalodesulfovibrio gigas DSM 1382 = ATCC 19364]
MLKHGTPSSSSPLTAFAGLGLDLADAEHFASTLTPWLRALTPPPPLVPRIPCIAGIPSPRARLFVTGRLARAP